MAESNHTLSSSISEQSELIYKQKTEEYEKGCKFLSLLIKKFDELVHEYNKNQCGESSLSLELLNKFRVQLYSTRDKQIALLNELTEISTKFVPYFHQLQDTVEKFDSHLQIMIDLAQDAEHNDKPFRG